MKKQIGNYSVWCFSEVINKSGIDLDTNCCFLKKTEYFDIFCLKQLPDC